MVLDLIPLALYFKVVGFCGEGRNNKTGICSQHNFFNILKSEDFSFSFWKPRFFVRWLIVLLSLLCLWDFPSTPLIHVTLEKPLNCSRYVVIILRKTLHRFACCFPFHTMVWCDWLIVCVMLPWELWKKKKNSTLWSFCIMKPLCPWHHWKFQITCFV